jgi:peptidylprolyl isomerase
VDLENRQLLSASLAPLSNLTVPAQMGYQVPLDGSGDLDPSQSYQVTSSNPDVKVSVAQGQFWTLHVQHTASMTPDDISFSGSITFQLFEDLTPQTVARITQFTNDGYYNGKDFTRIIGGFPGSMDYVAQGGAPNPDGTGSSGQPGTPFASEIVQQLAFTGTGQLGMANAGPGTVTNDTQFFVTTGSPPFLDYSFTIFGQVVSGSNVLAEMTRVATQPNSAIFGENSLPVSPIVITSATLSSSNVNGVIHVDATGALPGTSANITVTATDPTDGTHVSQTFKLTTTAYNGPTNPPVNFKPFATPVTTTTAENGAISVQLAGSSGYPGSNQPMQSYILVTAPSHGTLSQFNPLDGTVVYTPDPGFSGVDSFQFEYQNSSAPIHPPVHAFSNPGLVTITVTPLPPPLVRVSQVREVFNKHHELTKILVQFSGAVNATQAVQASTYRLTMPGKMASCHTETTRVIKLSKRAYESSSFRVVLKVKTPFALKRKAELLILGQPPAGLTDSFGRLIDGDDNGTPGGNATVLITRSGVIL